MTEPHGEIQGITQGREKGGQQQLDLWPGHLGHPGLYPATPGHLRPVEATEVSGQSLGLGPASGSASVHSSLWCEGAGGERGTLAPAPKHCEGETPFSDQLKDIR